MANAVLSVAVVILMHNSRFPLSNLHTCLAETDEREENVLEKNCDPRLAE